MKWLMTIVLALGLLIMGCTQASNLTDEERQAYQRSMQVYRLMQDGP